MCRALLDPQDSDTDRSETGREMRAGPGSYSVSERASGSMHGESDGRGVLAKSSADRFDYFASKVRAEPRAVPASWFCPVSVSNLISSVGSGTRLPVELSISCESHSRLGPRAWHCRITANCLTNTCGCQRI